MMKRYDYMGIRSGCNIELHVQLPSKVLRVVAVRLVSVRVTSSQFWINLEPSVEEFKARSLLYG